MELETEYRRLYDGALIKAALLLQDHLESVVDGVERIDSVCTRAKDPQRFISKALKLNTDDTIKYDDPLNQIQDQIGARITVFYLSDVEIVKDKIIKYLKPIEIQEKSPKEDSEFGYFGTHFILRIPEDVIPDNKEEFCFPDFFELQIKTLFQHAWSEAHHDLGYKSIRTLTSEERRKIAFTAAQAWGADQIFEELSKTLTKDNDN